MSDIDKLLADIDAATLKNFGRGLTAEEREQMRTWLGTLQVLQANLEVLVADIRDMRAAVQGQIEAVSMIKREHPEAQTAALVMILERQMEQFEKTLCQHHDYWRQAAYGVSSRFAPTVATQQNDPGSQLN